jgi:hypothetical protein
MDKRIFYGEITPNDFSEALTAHFNRGNLCTQVVGEPHNLKVQVASMRNASSGGQTAVTIHLQTVEDGVMVSVGQQAWLGVAASLGQSAIATLMNPWNLLNRLDDIAQDIESLKLVENVWGFIKRLPGARRQPTALGAFASPDLRILPYGQQGRRAILHGLRRPARKNAATHLYELRICLAHKRSKFVRNAQSRSRCAIMHSHCIIISLAL